MIGNALRIISGFRLVLPSTYDQLFVERRLARRTLSRRLPAREHRAWIMLGEFGQIDREGVLRDFTANDIHLQADPSLSLGIDFPRAIEEWLPRVSCKRLPLVRFLCDKLEPSAWITFNFAS